MFSVSLFFIFIPVFLFT